VPQWPGRVRVAVAKSIVEAPASTSWAKMMPRLPKIGLPAATAFSLSPDRLNFKARLTMGATDCLRLNLPQPPVATMATKTARRGAAA
jgi:hypothetical protein